MEIADGEEWVLGYLHIQESTHKRDGLRLHVRVDKLGAVVDHILGHPYAPVYRNIRKRRGGGERGVDK